jgi:hypothetical protein
MQNETHSPRPLTYIACALLILIGLLGVFVENRKGPPSATHFSPYILAAAFLLSGGITLVALRLRYGGGLWFLVGLAFVTLSFARGAFVIQIHFQGRRLIDPVTFLWTTAALWGIGAYCLVWGHIRHRQRNCLTSHGTE